MIFTILITVGSLVVIPIAIFTLRRLDYRLRRKSQLGYLCGPVRRQLQQMVAASDETEAETVSEEPAQAPDVVAVPIAPVGLLTFQPESFTQTP